MTRQNAASVRRIKQAFSVYLAEVQAAIRDLEHSNNVASCEWPDISAIIDRVCAHYKIHPQALMSRRRDANTAWARQVCIWLAKKTTTHGNDRIAQVFNRSRNLINGTVTTVEDRMATDKRVKAELEQLLAA